MNLNEVLWITVGIFIGGTFVAAGCAALVLRHRRSNKHRCEEFTQWEEVISRYSRPANPARSSDIQSYFKGERINWTEHEEKRRCTLCGKTEVRKIKK
jgi:hypothetical protein